MHLFVLVLVLLSNTYSGLMVSRMMDLKKNTSAYRLQIVSLHHLYFKFMLYFQNKFAMVYIRKCHTVTQCKVIIWKRLDFLWGCEESTRITVRCMGEHTLNFCDKNSCFVFVYLLLTSLINICGCFMWLPFFSGQLGKLSCISPTPTVMQEGGRGRFELGRVPDTFWILQL